MKAFLFLCLLGATAAHAQTKPNQLETDGAYYTSKDKPVPVSQGAVRFKGANTVVLITADSVSIAWRAIRETLLAHGYSIATADSELHSFTTAPKAAGSTRLLTITGLVHALPSHETAIYLSAAYAFITPLLGFAWNINTATITRPVLWNSNVSDKQMFLQVESLGAAYPHPLRPPFFLVR